ncbi:MAG: transglutaminase-like cysteine peptidase [Micavibrio sp.]|nr:transglutaminase-like cysteine peptidase [Micavibrio sp.]
MTALSKKWAGKNEQNGRGKKRFTARKLGKAFLKTGISGAVAFASYNTYVPAKAREAVAATIDHVAGTRLEASKPPAYLPVAVKFSGGATPVIFNAASQNSLRLKDSTPNQWLMAVAHHAYLMTKPNFRQMYQDWMRQLEPYRHSTIAEKGKAVDGLVDSTVKYTSDMESSGLPEYWASPLETINSKKGDCEDFAILKYYAMRYLDVPPERLYIVGVGVHGSASLNHATLIVDTAEDPQQNFLQRWLEKPKAHTPSFSILEDDGTKDGKLLDMQTTNYRPFYALNENSIWMLKAPEPAAVPKAAAPVSPRTAARAI